MQNLYIGKLGYQIRIYCIASLANSPLNLGICRRHFVVQVAAASILPNQQHSSTESREYGCGNWFYILPICLSFKTSHEAPYLLIGGHDVAKLLCSLLCSISANSLPLEPKLFLPLQNKFISAVAMDRISGSFAGAVRAICQSMILAISISRFIMR
jgi:hypothetical protein